MMVNSMGEQDQNISGILQNNQRSENSAYSQLIDTESNRINQNQQQQL